MYFPCGASYFTSRASFLSNMPHAIQRNTGRKQILLVRHQFGRAGSKSTPEVKIEGAEWKLFRVVDVLEALLDGQPPRFRQSLVLRSD